MKFIIFAFLLHFLIPLESNNKSIKNNIFIEESIQDELGNVFIELGTAKKQLSDNEIIIVNAKIYKKRVNSTSQKSFRSYEKTLYRYNVVCVSLSEYQGELTSTWIYGLWVKVNDVPVTQPLYPTGKDVMVYTTPTIVHYIETEEENPRFKIGWTESVYDPKLIR